MKRAARLLQLAVFATAVLTLPRAARRARAQAGQYSTCITSFDTTYEEACATCCVNYASAGEVNAIQEEGDSSPGDQSAEDDYVDCGGAVTGGCDVDCGTVDWIVPFTDGSCCVPNNDYCGSDSDCCSGVCDLSVYSCATCVPDGDQAASGSDCCSGVWDGSTDTCLPQGCSTNSDCPFGYVCDLTTYQCVTCIPDGDACDPTLYDQAGCCSGDCDPSLYICTE